MARAQTDAEWLKGIDCVATGLAAPNADTVDREARFPWEAIDGLRAKRALSALAPVSLGGAGVSIEAVAAACFALGRACGSTAMIFAMHQVQVACIVRHLDGSPWFADFLREVGDDQLLVASITSEDGAGGDLGRSVAAATAPDDGVVAFEKHAPTVSYGEQADAFLTTVRRHPEAEPGDQVLVLTRAEQTNLEQRGSWDTLGMRGTCSPGFAASARFPIEQILAAPFARVCTESMTPISHILWSHVWLGIATDAFERARAFVRARARRISSEREPAAQLSRLMSELALLRGEVFIALREFTEASKGDRAALEEMATILRFNNLKLAASEQAPRICQGALSLCGVAAYRNDTPFSVGRHLRDTLSAAVMVANDRIHQTDANLLLIAKEI